MKYKRIPEVLKVSGLAFLMPLAIGACGKHPLLMAQVCLAGEADLEKFETEMRLIADALNMVFTDYSDQTSMKLRGMEAALEEVAPELETGFTEPVVHFSMVGEDRVRLSAFNQGAPFNQIAIGFSAARTPSRADELAARNLADAVLSQLQQHWSISVVPEGQGALPMSDCPAPVPQE